MTDTTDTAALREQAETAKVCGGMFAISGEQALSLLDQLEAERQRAERGEAAAGIIQESLIKEREHSANFEREANLYHEKCETAEAEIAALKAKLANPVVLPERRSSKSFVDDEFTNKDLAAIYNAARLEFKVKVLNAGFTVKE